MKIQKVEYMSRVHEKMFYTTREFSCFTIHLNINLDKLVLRVWNNDGMNIKLNQAEFHNMIQ